MNKLIITLLLLCMTTFLHANDEPKPVTLKDLTPEKKIEYAIEFLKRYDKKKSIVNWKIKIKKDRVVLNKRWGFQNIVLYDAYFIKKLKDEKKRNNNFE